MNMRERLQAALKDAMRAQEAARLSTLRLINAAIKDRDIAVRGDGQDAGVSDADILGILGKMVKQRQESARAYEDGWLNPDKYQPSAHGSPAEKGAMDRLQERPE